ncbi:MAG: nucleotidyltransferase domain-containing protein [Candidatus Marinimicrobia bacterium]|nr:nucleotidyltransferase domain-containing protein [Candidatus Neomarinimicrobiota bacterium]
MRISKSQIENLKSTIKMIHPQSKIYLFGSRTDDSKRGGDIDILILAKKKLNFIEKSKIKNSFFSEFGEQKIDLISFKYEDKDVFKKIALHEAVEL